MLPFYYICKTYSVPGYLQLRYGEAARSLSAVSFAIMTILMSGINMYSMAVIMKVILGWNIHFSIWVSSLTVAVYVMAGGLLFAIFTEVLQFVLIWLGCLVIPVAGLIETGGWSGMVQRITPISPDRILPISGGRWGLSPPIRWAHIGREWFSGGAWQFRSATGRRIFSWSSE
jgi:Na+/proline symporter